MPGAEIARPQVHRIALAQLAVLGPLCISLLAFDRVCAYSVLSGGLIAVVPQAYFAFVAFRRRGSGEEAVGGEESGLDVDAVGAGAAAGGAAAEALVGAAFEQGVEAHGLLLVPVVLEVHTVAQDVVDGDVLRAAR